MADKGTIVINVEECKGCGLCVKSCTPAVLRLAPYLNRYGYHPAIYSGLGCTGCGLCFFACPEPGGITVYRRAVHCGAGPRPAAASQAASGAVCHA